MFSIKLSNFFFFLISLVVANSSFLSSPATLMSWGCLISPCHFRALVPSSILFSGCGIQRYAVHRTEVP